MNKTKSEIINESEKVMSLEAYIKEYIDKNLSNQNFELNDMLRLASLGLNKNKNLLYIEMNNILLTAGEQKELKEYFNKLYMEHIPLQYITGFQDFYNEHYIVNEAVLIPRSDTEVLVEKAIEYISKYQYNTLIDMCTGSGCVGISIAKNSNIKNTILVDISNKALEVAQKNIVLNNVENKIQCMKSDLFDKIINCNDYNKQKYDIIVSNPPYIPTNDILNLSPEVKKEPILALDGGLDGMDIYSKILIQSKEVLKQDGILMLEIGYDELEKITDLITKTRDYTIVESVKDFGNNDRVVICRFHQK